MRMRTWLASIALSAPLSSCCLQDEIWHDRSLTLPMQTADARLAMLVQQCVDTANCDPLCSYDWTQYASTRYEDGGEVRNCKLTISMKSGRVLSYEGLETCEAGRRPRGYALGPCAAPTAVARYLAAQTALEAASVRAFADLVADLAALGAPAALRTRAIAAAADEVRHAQLCAVVARARGVAIAREPLAPAARRSRLELAIDNAVEGCVRETFAAAVVAYQARTALDPEVRAAMTAIAPDEAGHAELAWDIHAWLLGILAPGERAAIAAAIAGARRALSAAGDSALTAADRAALGLPDATAARYVIGELGRYAEARA